MQRAFSYDAENRQVTANINGCDMGGYVYDGDGQRVSKTVNGNTTVYVYDAFGNLAAEYGAAEASPCGTATCYITEDHLGSLRMLTDSNGANASGGTIICRLERSFRRARTDAPSVWVIGECGRCKSEVHGADTGPGDGAGLVDVRYLSSAQGRFQSPPKRVRTLEIRRPGTGIPMSATIR